MVTREEIHSDLAIPPGEFLAEVLDDLGMSQADLARHMGRPTQTINEIVKGTKALIPETALQLEQVVGVLAHVWLGLEAEYRLVGARRREEQQVKEETRLLSSFPYAEMVKLGCLPAERKAEDKVRQLRRFFNVASLQQLGQLPAYAAAFRLGGTREASGYGLAAWLHCGQLEATAATVEPFDRAKLTALVPGLRSLTTAPAHQVAAELRSRLAECGVVFTLFLHFPKTYGQGATFWTQPGKKAVLLMSNRGRYADIFWFSFFHELGHILKHGNSATFVEITDDADEKTPQEAEADQFARDTLIPPAPYQAFTLAGQFTGEAITRFALSVGIHPGIVVGRLQHERQVLHRTYLNGLRERWDLEGDSAEPAA